jgi:hypothetical protein
LKVLVQEVDGDVSDARDRLAGYKQERDLLRAENLQLRQKSGLLGNKALLRDFEVRKVCWLYFFPHGR